MNPKMTAQDAAKCLHKSEEWIYATLLERNLPFVKTQNQIFFGHETARALFAFKFEPKIIVCQIVKGGTGKTSLVYEFAARASLYGAKVLCIDMDQQGNLTNAFNVPAENVPVMVDILVDNHPILDSIVKVSSGIYLIPSRFENAMLDEVMRVKNYALEKVYRTLFWPLKAHYDLIIIDCPPSLGQSVAACALAGDYVIAPVTAEKFAMLGLDITRQSILELQETYHINIPLGVVINKFDLRTTLAQDALQQLLQDPILRNKLLKTPIRMSQEFPNAISKGRSIYDAVKPSSAKEDIDNFTREILGLEVDPIPLKYLRRKVACEG
jgi:chromosome partitioning protein